MFTYTTKVRISLPILKQVVEELYEAYKQIDPAGVKETHDQRSAFSRWNNINHFYRRLTHQEAPFVPILESDEDTVVIEVTASAKGNSARIYFKPSVTSLSKEIRKAILPVQKGNIFCYFDIKAAEYALRAIQAQDVEAIKVYSAGEDIYMHYAPLFPAGTPRNTIKTILIANMYGKSAYSTAKDLGCTETQAQRLLDEIASKTMLLTMLKRKIVSYCQRHQGYFSPNGFDQTDLIQVASINPEKGFDPCLAWSAYTQSALGFIFQQLSTNFLKIQNGASQTFLTIFDSVVAEIRPESLERFKEFMTKQISPLRPDSFKTGKFVYEAMYK